MFKKLFRSYFPAGMSEKYSPHHDGKIHIVEARRGRGKSYFFSFITLKSIEQRIPIKTNVDSYDFYNLAMLQMKKNRGNFDSFHDCLKWISENVLILDSWNQILESHDCVIILDEATNLFDARSSFKRNTPPIIYDWFHQSRKVRVTVWMATHNVEWLENRVRSVLDIFWTARKVNSKVRYKETFIPKSIILYGNDAGGVAKLGKQERARAEFICAVPFVLQLANIYDSWEIIKKIEGDVSYPSITQLQKVLQEKGAIRTADSMDKLRTRLDNFNTIHIPPPIQGGGMSLYPNDEKQTI